MILKAKTKYTSKLSKRLDDSSTMPKAYWSILNTFLNNKNPPINVDDEIISNSDKKAELFNLHFSSQCTPINNSNVLPPLVYKINEQMASVNIKEDDIYLIL